VHQHDNSWPVQVYFNETVLHAEGRRITVHIDANTLRPAPWSDRVRRDITALMRPQDSDGELGAAVGSRGAQAELISRPATTPAYYHGIPATVWLRTFRNPKSRRKRPAALAEDRQP
jgi:hypothetical protein